MSEVPDTTLPTWRGRAVLHVDMDAFFAAVEQLDHPQWRGLPVIVGGDPGGRGVVSTASYEARRYGVHSAMPAAQAARLCPEAVWARPRFDRYVELSRAVRDIFLSHTPNVEPTSIDEAYLDITPGDAGVHPLHIAEAIRTAVDALGLSCSLGLAAGKTIAKIASDHRKPHGITVVWPGEEASFLSPLPVTALGGVGRATADRLRHVGIHTLGELACLDQHTATELAGSWGPELVRRACGVDPRPVVDDRGVKSISNERTFATDIRETDEVEAALSSLVTQVAGRLRRRGLSARTATLKLRYADFTTKTAQRTLASPTDLDNDLVVVARELLHGAWSPGAGLRLLGFGTSGFETTARQLELLQHGAGQERRKALTTELDAIRERFGPDALRRGSELDR